MPNTFNQRVRLVRKTSKLNQTEFGKRIGITFGAISDIERGRANTSENVKRAICREFNVRRQWLEDGIEPMYNEQVSADEYIDKVLADGSDLQKAFLRAAAKRPDEEIAALIKFLEAVNAEINGTKKDPDA